MGQALGLGETEQLWLPSGPVYYNPTKTDFKSCTKKYSKTYVTGLASFGVADSCSFFQTRKLWLIPCMHWPLFVCSAHVRRYFVRSSQVWFCTNSFKTHFSPPIGTHRLHPIGCTAWVASPFLKKHLCHPLTCSVSQSVNLQPIDNVTIGNGQLYRLGLAADIDGRQKGRVYA